jgi:hypothetical protein
VVQSLYVPHVVSILTVAGQYRKILSSKITRKNFDSSAELCFLIDCDTLDGYVDHPHVIWHTYSTGSKSIYNS